MTLRTYTPTQPSRVQYISEDECMERVLRAIRTLRDSPDLEARFLKAGSKAAWPKMLVEWSDAVAQSDDELKPGVRIYRRDIPLEPFMDFVAVKNGVPPRDDEEGTEREDATRKAISDMMVAGEWWAKLAVIPFNIKEFEKRVVFFKRGYDDKGRPVKNAQVLDQRILDAKSKGFSDGMVGRIFALSEKEIGERLNRIKRDIFLIANRTARYADLHRIQSIGKERVTV